jgi:hypothetical protein
MGLLTCGSSLPCAFPSEDVNRESLFVNRKDLFLRLTVHEQRLTSHDSGIRAELLPAYSGGTVMDLHHLPRL